VPGANVKTTATNRKIRRLMTEIRDGQLIPRPEFQRRLVWSHKHKNAFIQTVLMDYPFPEIYIAAGEVDTATGEGKEMLVDGQQRITTLFQYFTASPDLRLEPDTGPYAALSEKKKKSFLEYEVVVRDLGNVSVAQIKEVFLRINSTRYALTAMEIHNARFDGEFKQFGERLAEHALFERHRVFSGTDIKRMEDTRYCLTVVATLLSGYFNRDDALEEFLTLYNDEFAAGERLQTEIDTVLKFIESCEFPDKLRVWNKSDLFTLIVESHRALCREKVMLKPTVVHDAALKFYQKVDLRGESESADSDVERYYLAAVQASNDRSSRVTRGEVIAKLLRECAGGSSKRK
jgi:hypothetical protein